MGKKYYSGHLLPDIEPLWDTAAHPFAYISVGSCENTGLSVDAGLRGRYAHLVFINTVGDIKLGSTVGTNAYVPRETPISAKTYLIALDDDCVESLSELLPGINTENWVESPNAYQTEAAAGEGPHWTNMTLYTTTGTRFLYATAPVDYFDLASWLTGFALGRTGRPLPFMPEEGTFMGCRYGSCVLPYELDWDKEKLPYVMILDFPETGTTVAWAMNRKVYKLLNSPGYALNADYDIKFACSRGRLRDTDGSIIDPVKWETPSYNTVSISYKGQNDFLWANFDIYRVDGTLFYAATPPEKLYV